MRLKIFDKFFAPTPPAPVRTIMPLKIAVASFEDDCPVNSGQLLADFLNQDPLCQTLFYDEPLDKSFLNLQSRNFFDFIDNGKNILKKTKADILIWGCREKDKIRLHFQTLRLYEKFEKPSFSLLECLYIPLEYLQEGNMPAAISDLIMGAVAAACDVWPQDFKREHLKERISKINQAGVPQGLSLDYMPGFLNMLGLLYLYAHAPALTSETTELITKFFAGAFQKMQSQRNHPLYANILVNWGQLYYLASESGIKNSYAACRRAIECLQAAKKHFNRYTYPYDFGHLALRLSKLSFYYWKQTSDIQALRDAVFHLREAEKVFSRMTFPQIWAAIQQDLGFYLSLTGMFSRNSDIAMLAVDNYKNFQKICTKEIRPLEWAKAEESIGNIFYNCGKQHNDEEYLEEAVKYYQSAADVYEEYKNMAACHQMQLCIQKADDYIMQQQKK